MMIPAAIHPEKRQLECRTAARAEHRRSMSGCSAFTHGVRFKIPLTPYDFARGRLRQALKKQLFIDLIMGLAAMKNRSNSSKQRLFHGNALPRARGLYRSGRTGF